jgi:hypothetical protein
MEYKIGLFDFALVETDILFADDSVKRASENNLNTHNSCSLIFYHYAQAIEKGLKGIISAHLDKILPDLLEGLSPYEQRVTRYDYLHELNSSHNFDYLFGEVRKVYPDISKELGFASANAIALSSANNVRYGIRSVDLRDVDTLRGEAKRLYNLLKNHIDKTYPDEKERAEILEREWKRRDDLVLNYKRSKEELARKEARKAKKRHKGRAEYEKL